MSGVGDSFSGALRTFAYWIHVGSVGHPLLEDVDYRRQLADEPSAFEQAYAIFANVVEVDGSGQVINAKYAEHRAAQYLRQYFVPSYVVTPPLEAWEVALHEPPSREDVKPWPIDPDD